ncbi:hypothetical protein BV20DRAFT_917313, partial [Pilatotrama ljubarskyi]
MSARAPFVPQRPASRATESKSDAAQPKSPPPAYEPFRPTGLLDPPPPEHRSPEAAAQDPPSTISSGSDNAASRGFAAKFRPLNLSGLRKKTDAQAPLNSGSANARQSVDGSGPPARSPKPFSSAQPARLGNPYFQNPGSLSMNTFKAPAAPAQTSGLAEDLSSNRAHIVSSTEGSHFGTYSDARDKVPPGPGADQFRFSHALDASFSSQRSRTASQPSLASIHEVAEEEEGDAHTRTLGPPAAGLYGDYAGGYSESSAFVGSAQDDGRFHQGLRRTTKRPERADDDGEEYAYGAGAKRYKAAADEAEFTAPYNGRATPAPYTACPFDRAVTSARNDIQPAPLPQTHGELLCGVSNEKEGRQALYRLLGQDLDVFVEAHADSYEESRKKWVECSVEEWTKGADDLADRFGKLLDLVKDHMTTKLTLYASLHTSIAEHKEVLMGREQTLGEARESLVREGGAVVGG